NGAAGGNDVIADSAAAGEDVGVFTLISEAAGTDLQITGGIRTGKLEPKPVPQHDAEPATQREAHLLLELFTTRRLDQLGGRDVHAKVWSQTDPLGHHRMGRGRQRYTTRQQDAGHPRVATH